MAAARIDAARSLLRVTRAAVALTRYGARGRDRLRILLLTLGMPLIRRWAAGRSVRVRVRIDGSEVDWSAGSYADIAVFDEVFTRNTYAVEVGADPATILDVGSHVGASVAYFARRYPHARIVAIEADPLNFAKLKRNVGALPNVTLVHAAAASHTGALTLFSAGGVDSWRSSTYRSSASQRAVSVAAVRLDDVLDRHGAGGPVLIKIDIEGGEYDVLSTFDGLDRVTAIVGEVHPWQMSASVEQFKALLDAFDIDLPASVVRDTSFRGVRRRASEPALHASHHRVRPE